MKDIEGEIFELLSDFVENNQIIKSDATLAELGIDSLTFIKLIIAIEKKYSIKFQGEMLDVAEFEKVSDLVEFIQKELERTSADQ